MKLSEPLRLGGKSIPITECCQAACVREGRAIKAEYLAGKRAKAAPEAPTLKEAIDTYIKAHSDSFFPLTIRGYRTRRKAQNKNTTFTRNVPAMIPDLAAAIQRDRKPAGPVLDITQNSLRCAIKKICREHNLPDVGVHGLRHSFASLAYHLQVPKSIAQLGRCHHHAQDLHPYRLLGCPPISDRHDNILCREGSRKAQERKSLANPLAFWCAFGVLKGARGI